MPWTSILRVNQITIRIAVMKHRTALTHFLSIDGPPLLQTKMSSKAITIPEPSGEYLAIIESFELIGRNSPSFSNQLSGLNFLVLIIMHFSIPVSFQRDSFSVEKTFRSCKSSRYEQFSFSFFFCSW